MNIQTLNGNAAGAQETMNRLKPVVSRMLALRAQGKFACDRIVRDLLEGRLVLYVASPLDQVRAALVEAGATVTPNAVRGEQIRLDGVEIGLHSPDLRGGDSALA